MATDWNDFEAVEEPAIDWNEFEAEPPLANLAGQRVNLPRALQGVRESRIGPAVFGKPEADYELAPGAALRNVMDSPVMPEIYTPGVSYVPGMVKAEASPFQPPPSLKLPSPDEELMKPLVNLVPENPAFAPAVVKATSDPRISPEQRATRIARLEGVSDSMRDTVNFFTSPFGLATLGIANMPKMAQSAISAAFAVHMGSQVPEIARELGAELGKPEAERDQKKIANLVTTAATTTGFSALAGAHAAKPGVQAIQERREAFLGEPAPRVEPRFQARTTDIGIEAPATFGEVPPGIVKAPPGIDIQAPTTLPMTRQETARQAAIRNFNERLDRMKFKGPKPTVPEGPEIGAELTTQPTPGMRQIKEPGSYDEFLSDLVGKVTPDMTVSQVQELYPGAFKRGDALINKEAAGELLSDAKKSVHPVDWMEQELNAGKKVSTEAAYDIGMKVRSIEDLERLLKYSEQTQAQNKAAIAAGDVKALFKPRNMQVQIPREAVEAALGVGSAKTHPGLPENRPLDVRSFPEAREWWKKNAKRFGEEIEQKRKEEFGETEATAAEAPKPEVPLEPLTPAVVENPPKPGSREAESLQAQELDAALERQAEWVNKNIEKSKAPEPGFLNVPRSKWTVDYLEALGPTGRAPVIRQAIAALKDVGGKTKLGENATPQTLLKAVNEIMDLRAKQQAAKPVVSPVTPPPGDMVKVYHGEGGAEGAGLGGFSVSEIPEYAAAFGPRQSVVEVPRAVLEQMKEEARQRGEPTNLILPEEYQKQMRPVEKPIEPPVNETSFITREAVEASKGNLTESEVDELGRLLTAEEFGMLDAAQTKRLAELRKKSEAPPVPEAPAKPPEVTAPPSVTPERSAKVQLPKSEERKPTVAEEEAAARPDKAYFEKFKDLESKRDDAGKELAAANAVLDKAKALSRSNKQRMQRVNDAQTKVDEAQAKVDAAWDALNKLRTERQVEAYDWDSYVKWGKELPPEREVNYGTTPKPAETKPPVAETAPAATESGIIKNSPVPLFPEIEAEIKSGNMAKAQELLNKWPDYQDRGKWTVSDVGMLSALSEVNPDVSRMNVRGKKFWEYVVSIREGKKEKTAPAATEPPVITIPESEGPKLEKTYLADKLVTSNVYEHGGKKYVVNGIAHKGQTGQEFTAFEIIPKEEWKGETFASKKPIYDKMQKGEIQRGDHTGLIIKVKGKEYVLANPTTFSWTKEAAKPSPAPVEPKPVTPVLPTGLSGKVIISDLTPEQIKALAESAGVKMDKATTQKLQELENKGLLDKSVIEPKPVTPSVTEKPAIAKVAAEVSKVAETEGKRSAKELKSEIVQRLEEALGNAHGNTEDYFPGLYVKIPKTLKESHVLTDRPVEGTRPLADWLDDRVSKKDPDLNRDTMMGGKFIAEALERKKVPKVTISIPGDGEFTVWSTKDNIQRLIDRANKISTKPGEPVAIKKLGVSKEDRDWIREQLESQTQVMPPGPVPQIDNSAAIAELNRELKLEQKKLDKNVAKMGTMVPPPIVAEITRKISTRMAKIQDKIDALEAEQGTKTMPPGPGAASPAEFVEREIEAGRTPPEPPRDSNPGVPIDGGEIPTPEIVRKANDFGILNRLNSGQWTFYFGRLGQAAKAAWERMALGEFKMRENIQRDIADYVDAPLKQLPREFQKDGGKLFAELLDGRTLESIESEYSGRPKGDIVIEQARRVKTRLEEIRTTMRDIKRDSYRAALMSMEKATLERLYEENIFPDTQGKPKQDLADALTLDQFPDDWGIADGSYLPHMFFGQWKITARIPGMEQPQFITRAKTPAEAKARIFELTQRNPEYRNADFTIEQDMVIPADMIRLGDGQFWRLIAQMKERSQMDMNPKEAIQGIIGRKSSKQKYFGNTLHRTGALGYSKQYRQLMTAYLSGFHRWKELTAMNRDVQPLIEQVKREGRTNAAGRLQDIMDNLWGKPSQMTLDFDAFMRDVPVLRDIVKPLALDRWARFINTTITNLTLRTVRFGVVNRLQPLQGLYPLIGEKLMVKAKLLQHSAEGKRLLDEGGVTSDVGQYASEISSASKFSKGVERLTGEKSNQELAFLGMYLHGIEKGLDRAGAIRYAKLRGQLMTQFHPLVVDTPPIMEGPLGRVTFQFKRFPVKQLELLTQMAMDRNVPGLVRYFATMAAMGGIALGLKQVYADKEKRLKIKRTLNKSLGEKGADYMFYGLPGLAGADLSGSLMLGDEPFGANFPEKLGRTVMGPAPTIAYETGKAIMTPAREAMGTGEKAIAIARKIPTLRQLVDFYDLVRGSTDVTSPDGETKYRRKMRDVILGMGSFRSANEANIQLAVSGAMEIEKESSKLKNAIWVASQSHDNSKVTSAREDIKKFNERWPELAITPEELQKYFTYRKGNQPKTDTERALGKKYRVLMPR